jgi:hypothetical protein
MILPYDVFDSIAQHCDPKTLLNLVTSNPQFIKQFTAKKYIVNVNHENILSGSILVHTKCQDVYKIERYLRYLKRIFNVDDSIGRNTMYVTKFFGVYMYQLIVKDLDIFFQGIKLLHKKQHAYPDFDLRDFGMTYTPDSTDTICGLFEQMQDELSNHKLAIIHLPNSQSYCLFDVYPSSSCQREHKENLVLSPRALQALFH